MYQPRPPPTISLKHDWMKELDSEVAGSSKDTQRIQPQPKTQLPRTVRPVGGQESTQEIEKDILFGQQDIKHSTRTERPVGGLKSILSCVSMPIKIEEKDQARTGRRSCGRSRKLPRSRAREEDRKSSSSRSISSRLTTE